MTIHYNSRYASGRLLTIREDVRPLMNGTSKFVLRSFPQEITGTYATYEWRDGDRLDRVAEFFLKDPLRWWEIMDINPDIMHPSDIKPGQVIRVPIGELEVRT